MHHLVENATIQQSGPLISPGQNLIEKNDSNKPATKDNVKSNTIQLDINLMDSLGAVEGTKENVARHEIYHGANIDTDPQHQEQVEQNPDLERQDEAAAQEFADQDQSEPDSMTQDESQQSVEDALGVQHGNAPEKKPAQ